MKWRTIRRTIAAAIRENFLPGLALQALMAAFLIAYFTHDGTRAFLSAVSDVKRQAGLAFAFFSYVLAAALLPEFLRIVFFQSGRPSRRNLLNLLVAAPAWGLMGVVVDIFYRCQAAWFGDGASAASVVPKVAVDQFLFSPFFSHPVMVGYFALCAGGFRREAWREVLRGGFYVEKVVPVVVAGWMIWTPGVSVVYSMPQLLQIPVAVIIQCFWVLVFTMIGARRSRKR